MIIWNLKTPLTFIASLIWNFSEYFEIPLSKKLAPIIFHEMMGYKKKKKIYD